MIKHAAIWDVQLFSRFEREVESIAALHPDRLAEVLERSCDIKAEVVSRDERESGLRMLLNFGHTLGHAIEALAGYRRFLHGEAVAIGMGFAARRSEELGYAPQGVAFRLRELLARTGLPTQVPDYPRRAYLEALRVDKKRKDRHIHFVVLRELGRAEVVPLLPAEILPRRFPQAARRNA